MKGTRKRILNAAAKVFSEKGFHSAKMDDIAETARVSKGTLYYNFQSKSDLFSATVTEGLEYIIEGMRGALESDLPFVDHFRLLIEQNVALYLEYSDLARIVFNEVGSGIDEAVLRDIDRVRNRYLDFISELLQTGMDMGYLRKADPRLAAVSIVGMIDNLCNFLLKNPETVSQGQMVDALHFILARGLLI